MTKQEPSRDLKSIDSVPEGILIIFRRIETLVPARTSPLQLALSPGLVAQTEVTDIGDTDI